MSEGHPFLQVYTATRSTAQAQRPGSTHSRLGVMAHMVHKSHEEKMELSGRYWTFTQPTQHSCFRVNEPPEDTGGQTMRPISRALLGLWGNSWEGAEDSQHPCPVIAGQR